MKHFKFRIHHHFFLINEVMMNTECIRNMSWSLNVVRGFFKKNGYFSVIRTIGLVALFAIFFYLAVTLYTTPR